MKQDLDQLMAKRNLDAFVIVSDENYNPLVDYMTNGARVFGGYVLKKRDQPAVLFVNPMEIEEAAHSGLRVVSYSDINYTELLSNRLPESALQVELWKRLLGLAGITGGRVGIYGTADLNVYLELFRLFDQQLTGFELVGESGMTLFDEAMLTKDADELARIRTVAQKTNEVLQLTWDWIGTHRQHEDGQVINAEGTPLTIGAVKQFVLQALLERDLEDTGMIFAQGRDGAFPHSRGNDAETLRTGQAIVFDLFPRERGGGYHHDVTRTWSIGYATPQVQALYDTVMEAFDRSLEMTQAGQSAQVPQLTVLDYFESLGHPTRRSHGDTHNGYVHSLGHGVGLKIHERPSLSQFRDDVLQSGNVITLEPGLYYPDQNMGCRIEDMVMIDDSGAVVTLTTFHKQLVLPLQD